MPELVEQMYCSQQIVIPPKYPYILKRYCKAAIKTQPYDLLRWSFEYFKALSQNRTPPVKLRLEYPVYSTEGGLTRGCLKVIANQLSGMKELPLSVVKAAWQGFCLDQHELTRIMCLCEVYLREETVPFLNFIAVAGGMLTKTLTHTMILLCESLTKEPDGGSAAISVHDFFTMYKFLANIDASKDVKYINGYREGDYPEPDTFLSEEERPEVEYEMQGEHLLDSYWEGEEQDLQMLTLIDDHVARTTRFSVKLNMPVMGKIERSPSAERAGKIERENYLMERKGRAVPSEDVDEKLRQLSGARMTSIDAAPTAVAPKPAEVEEKKKVGVEVFVLDEEGMEIPYEIYGEPTKDYNAYEEAYGEEETHDASAAQTDVEEELPTELVDTIAVFVSECYESREKRLEDLTQTFEEIAAIVHKFKSANYDLGMVAGRQMSTTSGEFIVHQIERDIMAYIDEQIGILPDPDLKKKKAKPEEVEMIKQMLETFLDENMDVIVPEIEEVEEEELPIPQITVVYAVPGIGPSVEEEIIREFEKYVFDVCKVQADLFMPRNIRHFMCPPLEKYIEYKYDDEKEELPTGGLITE